MANRTDVHLDELYREVVMDHHRTPRGRAPLARVDARARGFNPVCGDEVAVAVALAGDRIEGIEVLGRGCAICTASGSIMAELLTGTTSAAAAATAAAFRALLRGEPRDGNVDLGDAEALEGVRHFVVRIKCAMLPWVTFENAINASATGAEQPDSTTETEGARAWTV